MTLIVALWVCMPAMAQPTPVESLESAPEGGVGSSSLAAQSQQVVAARTIWSSPQASPGSQRVLAVRVDIAPTYHINPQKDQIPGDVSYLIPTTLEVVQPPAGVRIGAIQFPQAHEVHIAFAEKSQTLMAYEGAVTLYVPVTVEPDVPLGKMTIRLKLGYQACDANNCLFPQTLDLDAVLEIVPPGTAAPQADASLFAGFDPAGFDVPAGIPAGANDSPVISFDLFGYSFSLDPTGMLGTTLLLSIAALGGFLLNLTPCVLPVIPLKIMGLSQSAGNRARCFMLGVAMSAGVVAFWLGLGVAISAVSGFTAANQLFQYPVFTITVGVVIAVMAVGMCGLFAVRLPRFVYAINPKHDSYAGSFGFGMMTAVLSTPCTAPFMGAAAAWAATQAPATTLATFAAIGLGMALPYLVLSAYPKLVDRMPRTGPASELLKQVMGLCMLAAAAYFVGVGLSSMWAKPPLPPSRVYWWPVMALLFAAGAWLAWRTIRITPAATKRGIFAGLGAILMIASAYGGFALTKKGPIEWVYYTPERFEAALQNGQVVVMDFTAEWCLNCKWLEKNILGQKKVAQMLSDEGVVPIRVDLTGNNDTGNRMLQRTGRLTIPLLVVYASDGGEVFKSDFYTADQVLEAIKTARSHALSSR